jgi:hypothetical protein
MYLVILFFKSKLSSCFLSLYLCNVQVFFHAILISYLCFFIPFLYLVNLYHVYVLMLFIFFSSLCLVKLIMSR